MLAYLVMLFFILNWSSLPVHLKNKRHPHICKLRSDWWSQSGGKLTPRCLTYWTQLEWIWWSKNLSRQARWVAGHYSDLHWWGLPAFLWTASAGNVPGRWISEIYQKMVMDTQQWNGQDKTAKGIVKWAAYVSYPVYCWRGKYVQMILGKNIS